MTKDTKIIVGVAAVAVAIYIFIKVKKSKVADPAAGLAKKDNDTTTGSEQQKNVFGLDATTTSAQNDREESSMEKAIGDIPTSNLDHSQTDDLPPLAVVSGYMPLESSQPGGPNAVVQAGNDSRGVIEVVQNSNESGGTEII